MKHLEYNEGGKVIKVIKDHCEVTQSEMADKMFVTKSYVSQLSLGKRDISLTKFLNLCIDLECDPSEIIKIFLKKVKQ